MFLFRKFSGRSVLSTIRQGESNKGSQDENDISKQALDQAREYVSEGDYEEALWILERLGQLNPALKEVAELGAVAEVCNAASSRSCACSSEKRNPDWYRILKVDEKSEPSAIKKRYRHLALLLHPDKNKHVKAEAAFKLVSEAYACLSDKKKREIFNVRRSYTKCKHCRSGAASGSERWSDYHVLREKTSLRRPGSSPDLTQTDWILDQERLRMFRVRARARVFGNLEKAWKERGFAGLDRTSIGKERFERNPKGEIKTDHYGWKTETTRKKEETLSDCGSVVRDTELGAEVDMMGASEEAVVSQQQLYRPCKNLGVLIRDLQAELISSTEIKEDEVDEQEVVGFQKENVLGPDARDSETHVQDGNGAASAGKEPFCIGGNLSPSSSAYGHNCSFHDRSFEPKNDATPPNDIISEQRFDKGFLWKNKRGHDSIHGKPTAMEGRRVQEKDFIKSVTEDAGAVLRKRNLCRQTRQDDSLDLEETILRTQREKSEQLLKTLQRLREETKTVAASLNHLCSGYNS